MSSLQRRASWVNPARPVTGPKSDLSKINQVVIHYPGVDPGALNLNNPISVLRNTHDFYLGKKPTGYAIGYNFATFPSGRFELRGFDIQNAANKGHNDHTLSINCMVNGADEMPQVQLEYTRDMIEEIFARLGRRVPLIAHGRLPGAATACPGAGIKRQLDAGLLLPLAVKPQPAPEVPATPETPGPETPVPPAQPPEDDDMANIGIIRIGAGNPEIDDPSHPDVFKPSANAQFIGFYVGEGRFFDVKWISTQAQIEARDHHRAGGARSFAFGKHVMKDTWVDKVPQGDGLTTWSDPDFAGVG